METNETKTGTEQGKQVSLDEVLAQHEAARTAVNANSQFVQVQNHETVTMPFTGIVLARSASGTDNAGKAWNADKLDFLLDAKTPEGKDKIWSVTNTNKIVPELITILKKGPAKISIHREGEGVSTKYSISRERTL